MKKILLSLWLFPVSILGSDSSVAENNTQTCKESKAPQECIVIQYKNNDIESYEERSSYGWSVFCSLWKKDGYVYCKNYWPNTVFNDDCPFQGEEAL